MDVATIRRKKKPPLLSRSLKNLIGQHSDINNNPHGRSPVEYYRHVYVNETTGKALEAVAQMEKCSIKEAAEHLLEDAYRQYITDNILKYNELKASNELDLTENARYRRFMRVLTQLVKKKDIHLKVPVKEILDG